MNSQQRFLLNCCALGLIFILTRSIFSLSEEIARAHEQTSLTEARVRLAASTRGFIEAFLNETAEFAKTSSTTRTILGKYGIVVQPEPSPKK